MHAYIHNVFSTGQTILAQSSSFHFIMWTLCVSEKVPRGRKWGLSGQEGRKQTGVFIFHPFNYVEYKQKNRDWLPVGAPQSLSCRRAASAHKPLGPGVKTFRTSVVTASGISAIHKKHWGSASHHTHCQEPAYCHNFSVCTHRLAGTASCPVWFLPLMNKKLKTEQIRVGCILWNRRSGSQSSSTHSANCCQCFALGQ